MYHIIIILSNKKTKYRAYHHSVYKLNYHLVFVTKYRNPCISSKIAIELKKIITDISEKWDVLVHEFGFESDHIHLLIELHPNIAPSKFINNLKTISSRMIRKKFQVYLSQYYWKPYFWSRSHLLISTGGVPIEIIKKYIQKQKGNSSPPKS